MKAIWARLKRRDWYLSPVKPLQLLSFSLLGHLLLLLPPLSLCTRLTRRKQNQKQHFGWCTEVVTQFLPSFPVHSSDLYKPSDQTVRRLLHHHSKTTLWGSADQKLSKKTWNLKWVMMRICHCNAVSNISHLYETQNLTSSKTRTPPDS